METSSLIVLALIDATSIGTLVIPIWLLLRRDYRSAIPKVLAYLGLIAVFYWVIGLLLRSGMSLASDIFQQPWAKAAGLVLGVLMLVWALSYRTDAQKEAARLKAGDAPGTAAPAAISPKLTSRVGTALDTRTGVAVLAVVAGLLELPTMLPYLAAMGVLQGTGWPAATQMLVLAGYCLVMIAPALVLCAVRAILGERIDGWLKTASAKLTKISQESLGWIVGIAGYLLIRACLKDTNLSQLIHSIF